MTHDELLAKINRPQIHTINVDGLASMIEVQHLMAFRNALYEVVKLHRQANEGGYCEICPDFDYPCETIQAIEKELG